MLSQKQCIEEIRRCLAENNDASLRNATRTMADYAKITFREIGKHYSTFAVVKDVQIKHRFGLLSTVLPELAQYEKMFRTIENNRMIVDHSDTKVFSLSELEDFFRQIECFQSDYEKKVLPKLKSLSDTPKDKLKEEWKPMPFLIAELKKYDQWSFANYSEFEVDINEMEDIVKKVDKLDAQTINDYRLKLSVLQIRINNALVQAELELQDTAAEAEYDQMMGK